MTDSDRLQSFIKKLKFSPPPVHHEIHSDLDSFDNSYLVPALLELIASSTQPATKKVAIQSLEYLAGSESLKPLLEIVLNEDDKQLLLVAIRMLAYLGDKAAIASLNKIVNRSGDPEIIQVASQAIQVIQGIAPKYTLDDI